MQNQKYVDGNVVSAMNRKSFSLLRRAFLKAYLIIFNLIITNKFLHKHSRTFYKYKKKRKLENRYLYVIQIEEKNQYWYVISIRIDISIGKAKSFKIS